MPTLSDYRQSLLDQVDSDPAPSSDFVRRVDGFINRAVQQLADEVPFLFFETEIRFRTEPTVEPLGPTDLMAPLDNDPGTHGSGDGAISPNVMDLVLLATDPLAQTWKYDRSWDGRSIDIIDATTREVIQRNKIRTVSRPNTDHIHVSLVTPFDRTRWGDGPFTWRVYTPVYYLPDNVIEWRSGRILGSNSLHEISVLGQKEAEDYWYFEDYDDSSVGPPRYVYRRGFSRPLRALAQAPSVVSGSASFGIIDWIGPEPPGVFRYAVTVTWGKRSRAYQHEGMPYPGYQGEIWSLSADGVGYEEDAGRNRMRSPLWESLPSPVSAEITVPPLDQVTGNLPTANIVVLPNIDYMLGYMATYQTGSSGSGSVVYNSANQLGSGLHYRIYRRRITEDFTNYDELGGATKTATTTGVPFLGKLEIDDSYYLLAEVPVTPKAGANVSFYGDNGSLTPDYSVRMPQVAGYQGLRFQPQPDAEYDIGVRVLQRPAQLENDQDAPSLPTEATDLVVYRAMVYYYDAMKEPGLSDRAESKYNGALEDIRVRYGDLRPDDQVIYRKPARANRFRQTQRFRWKRFSE